MRNQNQRGEGELIFLLIFGVIVVYSIGYFIKLGAMDAESTATKNKKQTSSPTPSSKEKNKINGDQGQASTPDKIRHLYVISSVSGKILLHSTIRGKVDQQGGDSKPGDDKHTEQTVIYWSDGNGKQQNFILKDGNILISEDPLPGVEIYIDLNPPEKQ